MHTITLSFFDPYKIALSGQAFRIHPIDDSHVETVAHGRYLQIASLGDNKFAFSCSEQEFNDIWREYFDLDVNYDEIVETIDKNDDYLKAAAIYGQGIRILKQDIFETTISYIISQRRSIPSITTCVDRLCEALGDRIEIPILEPPFIKPIKDDYYSFPTPSAVADASVELINGIGAGYRTPYILGAANDFVSGKLNPNSMTDMDSDSLFSVLMNMFGVGIKVANCIMLFAFHRTERFPIDVWIQKIIDKYYEGTFNPDFYPGTAGIMQQFMFYYERCEKTH